MTTLKETTVEMAVRDLVGADNESRYYTTAQNFSTTPSETPANTVFESRILGLPKVTRRMFHGSGTEGHSKVGFGTLDLNNEDGALDVFLSDLAVDGKEYIQRQGVPTAAYPGSWQTVLTATMERASPSGTRMHVGLRDYMAEMELELQANKYDGDNVLPDGLEGTADDLKGKPKPLTYGTVFNIPCPCVNTSKWIFQVHDGQVSSIPNVYDKGISLLVGFPPTQATAVLAGQLRAIAGNGSGTVLEGGDAGVLARSTDNGATFTSVTSPMGGDQISGMVWAFGLFIIGGSNGKLYTSVTGETGTWTSRTSNFGTDTIAKIRVNDAGTVAIAVGLNGKLSKSTNGTTWTAKTSGFGADTIFGVVSGPNQTWVAFGNLGEITRSTDDGETWSATGITSPATNHLVSGVYALGRYNVVGYAGVFLASYDGLKWFALPSPSGTGVDVYAIAYGDGLLVAVGITGTLAVSSDGFAWDLRTSSFASGDTIAEITFSNHRFHMVANDGKTATTSAPGTYASLADLEDDDLAPALGTFKAYTGATGSYFRLGSPPVGQVTADVIEGTNAAARTTAQIWARILDGPCGYAAGDWSAADVTAADTANASVIGVHFATEITRATALDYVAKGIGAWWGADRSGVFRLAVFTAPSGSPALSIVEKQIHGLECVPDGEAEVPAYRVIVRYARNYAVQSSDLAGGVTGARRAYLAAEWREAKDEDATAQTSHLLARVIIVETPLTTAADAATEATRLLTLRKAVRHRFKFLLTGLTDAQVAAVDLNAVIDLTHSRFDFENGELCRVIGIETTDDPSALHLEVWR